MFKINLMIFSFFIPISAFSSDYKSYCEIRKNKMIVAIVTDEDAVEFEGNFKIHTFDKENRPTGTFNRYKDIKVDANSKEYILEDYVDWYVDSCKVNMEDVRVEIEDHRPNNITIVNHQAPSPTPTVIVHEYKPSRPSVVFDFSLTNSFPIYTHTTRHHVHRYPRQDTVIIRENNRFQHSHDHVRVRTIR